MSMQEIQRLLSNPFFLSAFVKHETGRKIHKYELKAIIEECKEGYKQSINSTDVAFIEKQGMIEGYNRIADAVEHYVEQSLRLRDRLEE